MLWLAGIVAMAAAPQTAGRAELPSEALAALGRQDLPAAVVALDKAAAACAALKRGDDHCLDLYLGGANVAWRASDAASSEKFARGAVEIADRALPPAHDDRAVAHRYLVRTLIAQRKFAEAADSLAQSIKLAEAAANPGLASLYQQYHDVLYSAGKLAESEAALRKALTLFESGREANSRNHAVALGDMASWRREANAPDEAVPLAERAVAMIEQAAPDDPAKANIYRILGMSLNELGRYVEAEAALRRAIAVADANPRATAMERSKLYTSLAYAVDKQNRLEEGEALVRKVIALQEAALPPGAPQIAENYLNLAWNLDAQGKYVEAEAAIRKSVLLRETHMKPGDPGIATGYEGLAAILASQERHEEAETIRRRVVALREAEKPQDLERLAFAYSNLASSYDEQFRFAESEPLLRKGLALAERFYPAEHPELAAIYANLAHNVSSQGRWAEAESFHRKALAIWQKALPPTHPSIAMAMVTLSANLDVQGRQAEALQLMRQARAITQKLAPTHPERINGAWALADLLRKQGIAAAEARSLYRAAEAGAIERIGSFSGFDSAAQGELRKYRPIFVRQVDIAWQLSRQGAAR